MNSQPIVVLITVPNKEVGRQIAQALLEQRLAACINILPAINSLYNWEGKLQDEEEALLVVKSRAELFQERLVPAVQAIHPYKVPEILALPILAGLHSYLEWIEKETGYS